MEGNAVPREAWLLVGLLWPVGFLNYMDRLLITSMREPIVHSLPMTEAQFGLLTAIFLWIYGSINPAAGFWADRFSRRRMIILSLFVWSLFTAMTGLANSYLSLFIARAGMGISEACYLPAALALVCDFHPNRSRSLATGMIGSGLYAGTAFGGIGGYLAVYCGWRAGFLIFGAVGVTYALVLLRWLPDMMQKENDTPGLGGRASPPIRFIPAVTSLARQSGYWLVVAGLITIGLAMWLIYAWLPTYLREHFRVGMGVAGLSATGYTQAAAVAGLLIGGFLADRWAVVNPRGRIWIAALGCGLAAPSLYVMAATHQFFLAMVALTLFGLGMGFYSANTMPIIRYLVGERYSATGFGIAAGLSCIAGGGMTYAGGALRDHHVELGLVFQGSAVGVLVAGLLLLLTRRSAMRSVVEGDLRARLNVV